MYALAVGLSDQLSRNTLRTQMSALLLVIVLMIAGVLAVAFGVARRLVRPMVILVQAADRLSLGELETPVVLRSSDELGDLAEALERMRLSLRTAVARFSRPRPGG